MLFIAFGTMFHSLRVSHPVIVKNEFQRINQKLMTGDIVLRTGKGFISDMFKRTSVHQAKFSHAGILVIENGVEYVYHMMGNPESELNGLRKEKLVDFCNSGENSGFAIYRYPEFMEKDRAITDYMKSLSAQRPVFDESFELSTSNALYCSEMIYNVMMKCGGFTIPISSVEGKNFVGLDDLYLNGESIKITEVFY